MPRGIPGPVEAPLTLAEQVYRQMDRKQGPPWSNFMVDAIVEYVRQHDGDAGALSFIFDDWRIGDNDLSRFIHSTDDEDAAALATAIRFMSLPRRAALLDAWKVNIFILHARGALRT